MGQNVDLQAIFKKNFETLVDFTGLVAKDLGKIVAEAQDFSVTSLQANAALLNKLASARTISAVIQVQTDHAKAAYDATLARSKKFGELFNELSRVTVKSVMVGPDQSTAPLKIPSVGKTLQSAE
jgi:hypothetical protein